MPFARPTISEIRERIFSDIDARVPGADSRIRASVLSGIAHAQAGAVHGLYGYLAYLADQLFADTAEGAFLERLAAIQGLVRKPATFAEVTVRLTGITGAAVPLGTVLARADGPRYSTTALSVLAAGAAEVPAIALTAGAAANAVANTGVTLQSPVSGVDSAGSILTVDVAGADDESDDVLRARLLQVLREPPAGGSAGDYRTWALEVPGVTRVWVVEGLNGPGTVGVTFVLDDEPGSIIPGAPKVAEMQAYLEARRPVTATVLAFAPTEVPIDLTIEIFPDTAAVRAAAEAELADLLKREAAPGLVLPLSRISEAISSAAGESSHILTVPAADVTLQDQEVPTLGTVTWV